jgi:uncharacterized protein YjbJ (UPF0337 family)
MNKNNRTDSEESVANKTGGVVNQIKGNIKEGIGDLVNDPSLKREGMQDRAKGRLQEDYGDLKKKEAEIERDLDDASSRGRV